MDNKVIVISGSDLSGKATQVEALRRTMTQAYGYCTAFEFPDYGTAIGKIAGAMLDDAMISIEAIMPPNKAEYRALRHGSFCGKMAKGGPSTLYQLLMIANLFECQPKLKGALELGHVIWDRYAIDSWIYGMVDCGGNIGWIKQVQQGLIQPDYVIILDSSGFERPDEIPDDNERRSDFQQKVRIYAKQLAADNSDYWRVVECDQYLGLHKWRSIYEIASDVLSALQDLGFDASGLTPYLPGVIHDMQQEEFDARQV